MVVFAEKQIPLRGTFRYRVANYFGLQKLKDAVPNMSEFLERRYDITILSTPLIVPVGAYSLLAQRTYCMERFRQYNPRRNSKGYKSPLMPKILFGFTLGRSLLLSPFTIVGMYTPENARMEFSWWSLALSTEQGRRSTWIHEALHHLQRASKLKYARYAFPTRLESMALNAAVEGMAMEAERAYEQTVEGKEIFTFADKVKMVIGYAVSILCSPIRTALRLWGRREKYKEMPPDQKVDFITKHPILADIIYNPYRDGKAFFEEVVREFGAPTALRAVLDYPPILLDQIYNPQSYIEFVRAEMARSS